MKFIFLSMALLCAASAQAGLVTPSSYTLTTGEVGHFSYFDDTGKQLTDGILGADLWSADLGNGGAYEWVGWYITEPTMLAVFAQSVNITQVSIGFNRGAGGVALPSNVNIAGTNFALTRTELGEGKRGFLNFNVSLTGVSQVQITITDGATPSWIFMDEVQFAGTAGAGSVPEPGTTVLVAAGIGLAALARKRKG